MITLLTTVFVASIIGSLHCAGMCGGVVAMCVGIDDHSSRSAGRMGWQTHAAYNFGRMTSYVALGVIAGAIGSALDLGGSVLGMQRVAAIVAGATMIAMGLFALLQARGLHMKCLPIPGILQRIVNRGFDVAMKLPPVKRAACIGLVTAFLPCGWLYAFVLTAAGTGRADLGGLTMAAFWLGTVPVLLVIGMGLQGITSKFRRHVPTATAVVLVLIGAVTILGRLGTPAYADKLNLQYQQQQAAASDTNAGSADFVNSLDEETLPCCRSNDDEPDAD